MANLGISHRIAVILNRVDKIFLVLPLGQSDVRVFVFGSPENRGLASKTKRLSEEFIAQKKMNKG